MVQVAVVAVRCVRVMRPHTMRCRSAHATHANISRCAGVFCVCVCVFFVSDGPLPLDRMVLNIIQSFFFSFHRPNYLSALFLSFAFRTDNVESV